MADLTNDIQKINDIEVAANKPVSENLFTRLGGSLNGLIDRRFPLDIEIFTSSGTWTCPTGVTKVIAIGIGGGGGGGEGGENGISPSTQGDPGATGTNGNPTMFDGQNVGLGGVGGAGGRGGAGGSTPGAPGRGRDGGGSGQFFDNALGESRGGFGASGMYVFSGTAYGAGGAGGAGETAPSTGPGGGGAGGGQGKLGIREFTVIPGNNYNYTIGTGGAGGLGGAGDNGSAGSAGAICLLYTRITDV